MENLKKNNVMITVSEALALVQSRVHVLENTEVLQIDKALGFVLSETVLSPISMPPYRQSAMDGYAIHIGNTQHYNLIGEVRAGDADHPVLTLGEAVRIFTGAPVPDTANAVVMQEKVAVSDQILAIEVPIAVEENIRQKGDQIKTGEIALDVGTKLTPAAIGFLTGLGIEKVVVFQKPIITIITTGNELVAPGQPLLRGQIYESNAIMLTSALQSLGYSDIQCHKVADNFENTQSLIDKAIITSDLVLITGGISVGDYDFVGSALMKTGVEQIFYKVRQKPGKPLFFGKKRNTIVLALPGNPAAALSCFYIYAYQALEKMSGNHSFSLTTIQAKSLSNFHKKGDRAQFLKAVLTNDGVTILEGQSSAMLRTFSIANALVFVPEEKIKIKIGDTIEVICLPLI